LMLALPKTILFDFAAKPKKLNILSS